MTSELEEPPLDGFPDIAHTIHHISRIANDKAKFSKKFFLKDNNSPHRHIECRQYNGGCLPTPKADNKKAPVSRCGEPVLALPLW